MATFVELFAGCGGLSLGLKAARHELLFANELSPMAAETYAFNLLGADLSSDKFANTPVAERGVRWLRSQHGPRDVERRLSENPLESGAGQGGDELPDSFQGHLLIGDIRVLNKEIQESGALSGVRPDIVSGGPPCQSFSMAGLRDLGNHRNRLPWEFAKFVEVSRPKIVILENVSGILRPFAEGDKKVFAWFEVAKAFAAIGYAPTCLHVNAKDAGVAQNRPRFLMFAVSRDFLPQAKENLGPYAHILDWGTYLAGLTSEELEDAIAPLPNGIIDLTREDVAREHVNGPLGEFLTTLGMSYSVEDAIGELAWPRHPGRLPRTYVDEINRAFASYLIPADHSMEGQLRNDEHRSHSLKVQARFRLYQRLEELSTEHGLLVRCVLAFLRGDDNAFGEVSDLTPLLGGAGLRDLNGKLFEDPMAIEVLLKELRTRKRTQRALRLGSPAPAALSIPDDACHYGELRTLSVREMARIQSFPDEFEFRSVVTTGGARRSYQVPQYTQVGNAVPPKLGYAVGRFASRLLGEAVRESLFVQRPTPNRQSGGPSATE